MPRGLHFMFHWIPLAISLTQYSQRNPPTTYILALSQYKAQSFFITWINPKSLSFLLNCFLVQAYSAVSSEKRKREMHLSTAAVTELCWWLTVTQLPWEKHPQNSRAGQAWGHCANGFETSIWGVNLCSCWRVRGRHLTYLWVLVLIDDFRGTSVTIWGNYW